VITDKEEAALIGDIFYVACAEAKEEDTEEPAYPAAKPIPHSF
jgi:hypothetical protein